jgi:hemoglobin/transferrin/lactoferrin receptor protein
MLSAGVFAEDDWTLNEAVTLNAGGRFDHIDVRNDRSAQWTEGDRRQEGSMAHLGATCRMTEHVSGKAIVGTGYRAASLEERYQYLVLGDGRTRYGNPGLRPEKSRFGECGLEWRGEEGAVSASVFGNEVDDLIGERTVDASTIVNANIDEARIQGCEAEAKWQPLRAIACYGNAAYTEGKDLRKDTDLAGIAPLSGLLGVGLRRGMRGAWGYVETTFAAHQDKVPAGTAPAPGWSKTDLRIGWNFFGAQWRQSLYAGVQNLFDKEYHDYLTTYRGAAFNEPGRCFVGGYQASF